MMRITYLNGHMLRATFNYKEAELEDSDVAGTAGGSAAAATNTRRKRMAAGVGGNGEAREKGGSRRGKSLDESSERRPEGQEEKG